MKGLPLKSVTVEKFYQQVVDFCLSKSASKTSYAEEAQQFLLTYSHLNNNYATFQAPADDSLPKISCSNCAIIVELNLTRWHHSPCVPVNLVITAINDDFPRLHDAFLLHTVSEFEISCSFMQRVAVSHCPHVKYKPICKVALGETEVLEVGSY